MRLLEEIIEGRQACADWYALQPKTEDLDRENEGHQFFIEVLRDVYKLLSSLVPPATTEGADQPKSRHNRTLKEVDSDLTNPFALLEIEEPSATPLGQEPDPAASFASTSKKSNVHFEEDDKDDTAFRLFCFLEDARDIRKFVKETWQEYARGNISMLVATNVTEAGIGLLRISSVAFVAAKEAFRDWSYLTKYLSLRVHVTPNGLYVHPRSSSPDSNGTGSGLDVVDLICLAAGHHIHNLRIELNRWAEADSDHFLSNAKACVPHGLMEGDYYDLPNCLLIPTMNQLLIWQGCFKGDNAPNKGIYNRTFRGSEFIEGLANCYRTKEVPPWLPIAFQIYCDIYEIIGSDPGRLVRECLDKVSDMQRIVERHRKDHGEFVAYKNWDERLKDLDRHHEFLREHFISDSVFSKRHFEQQGVAVPTDKIMRSLFSLPCFMGTQLFIYKQEFHLTGSETAECGLLVLCMAHLYTSGRKMGLISTEWKDMDMIIAAHKPFEPLVLKPGGRADAYTCLRYFLLALGVPAEKFANGKIPKLPTLNKAFDKARKPVNTLRFSRSMSEAFMAEEKLGVSRKEVMEQVLAYMAASEDEKKVASKGGEKQHRQAAQHFTPQRLLSTFKKTFIADEPMLNFDYLSFWRDCRFMETAIRSIVEPSMPHASREETAWPISLLYHMLLLQAATPDSLLHAPGRPESPFEIACTMLEKCLNMSDDIPERFASNKFSAPALRQSSGRIPKDMRPKLKEFDPSSITTSLAEEILLCEPCVFAHKTGSATTIYDTKGSAAKLEKLCALEAKIMEAVQRGEEEGAVICSETTTAT